MYNLTHKELDAAEALIKLSQESFECRSCTSGEGNPSFDSLSDLQHHKAHEHGLSHHCGEECRESFSNLETLEKHRQEVHLVGQELRCLQEGCSLKTELGEVVVRNHIRAEHTHSDEEDEGVEKA